MEDWFFNNHRRFNPLLQEHVLVSPERWRRPWEGKVEASAKADLPEYDPKCYLCPRNTRSSQILNPDYQGPFIFNNDFPALQESAYDQKSHQALDGLIQASNVRGICRVICFSPRHDLTLSHLPEDSIFQVWRALQQEFLDLAKHPWIKYVQVFENKGAVMGCSNPHPHGQIWAGDFVPSLVERETQSQQLFYEKHRRTLLSVYLEWELEQQERLLLENASFAVVVPFWAMWPFETLLIPKRPTSYLSELQEHELKDFAAITKRLSIIYDKLFDTSFPYSAGIHQAPINLEDYPYWHWHMHFYPPLLRSATVKKFMVGYEMLGEPQRDITPETAAERLRSLV